jgi:hypothetical protein
MWAERGVDHMFGKQKMLRPREVQAATYPNPIQLLDLRRDFTLLLFFTALLDNAGECAPNLMPLLLRAAFSVPYQDSMLAQCAASMAFHALALE